MKRFFELVGLVLLLALGLLVILIILEFFGYRTHG